MGIGDVGDPKQTSGTTRHFLPTMWIRVLHLGLVSARLHKLQATNRSPQKHQQARFTF